MGRRRLRVEVGAGDEGRGQRVVGPRVVDVEVEEGVVAHEGVLVARHVRRVPGREVRLGVRSRLGGR